MKASWMLLEEGVSSLNIVRAGGRRWMFVLSVTSPYRPNLAFSLSLSLSLSLVGVHAGSESSSRVFVSANEISFHSIGFWYVHIYILISLVVLRVYCLTITKHV